MNFFWIFCIVNATREFLAGVYVRMARLHFNVGNSFFSRDLYVRCLLVRGLNARRSNATRAEQGDEILIPL